MRPELEPPSWALPNSSNTESLIDNKWLLLIQTTKFWDDLLWNIKYKEHQFFFWNICLFIGQFAYYIF